MKTFFSILLLSLVSVTAFASTEFIANEHIAILLDNDHARGKLKVLPVDCTEIKGDNETKDEYFRFYQCKTGLVFAVTFDKKTLKGGVMMMSPDGQKEISSAAFKNTDITKIK